MLMTNYLETSAVNHFLRGSNVAVPANVYFALFTSDPGEAGSQASEVSGNSYARSAITFGAPSSGVSSNSVASTFPTPTGAWGVVTHLGIMDAASGGNMLMYGPLSVPKSVTASDPFVLNTGAIQISCVGGWSNWLRDAFLNHFFRATATATISPYLAAYTVAPGNGDSGTEVSGGSYARVAVTFSAPTDGATSNSGNIQFPEATAGWGTVVAFGLRSASSGGNLLASMTLPVSKTLTSGDVLSVANTKLTASFS